MGQACGCWPGSRRFSPTREIFHIVYRPEQHFRVGTPVLAPKMGSMSIAALSSRAHVPIRAIGARHRPQIAWHLLSLAAHDRYLRFGYPASDEQIRAYVNGIDFDQDRVFGIFDDELELLAMAHLARLAEHQHVRAAEFAVSVAANERGRGHGMRLFEHAATHAINAGIDVLHIHALSENAAMLHIARKAGALIEREGSESQARLRLPAASLQTMTRQWMTEQAGYLDYWLKSEGLALRDALPAAGSACPGRCRP